MDRPWDTDVVIEPRKVLRVLLIIIAVLVALSTAGQVLQRNAPDVPFRDGIANLLSVYREGSIPTLYSSVMLLVAAILCATIAKARRRGSRPYARHWWVLSVTFVAMAIDEFAQLHEQAVEPVRALFDIQSGPLWFSWVIPGAALVVAFGLAFLPFMRHLPRTTRRLVWLAALLFVGGALGFEMAEGWFTSTYGPESVVRAALITIEEALEMTAVAIFVYGLLTYIAITLPDAAWRLRVGGGGAPPGGGPRRGTPGWARSRTRCCPGRRRASDRPGRPGPRRSRCRW
jgi:hypothetical protein